MGNEKAAGWPCKPEEVVDATLRAEGGRPTWNLLDA